MLVLDRRPVRVVRWFDATALIGGREQALTVAAGIGWFHLGERVPAGIGFERTVLVDLERGARIRADHPAAESVALPDGGVAILRNRLAGAATVVAIHQSRGSEIRQLGEIVGHLGAPLQDPSGRGILVPEYTSHSFFDGLGPLEVRLWRLQPGTPPVRLSTTPLAGRLWWLVPATDDGLLCVLRHTEDHEAYLSAYRVEGDRLVRLWETESPYGLLAGSSDGRRAWFACWKSDLSGLDVRRLEAEPVAYDHRRDFDRPRPRTPSAVLCEGGVEGDGEPDSDDPDSVARWLAAHGHELDHDERVARTAGARRRWPSSPAVAAVAAHFALVSNAPQLAADLLESVDLGALVGPAGKHAMHLLANAHLHLGDLDRAEGLLREAKELPGSCPIEPDREIVRVLRGAQPLSEPAELTARIVEACARADERLAADDAEGAVLALDAEIFWHVREIQSAARRAEAALAWTDGPYGPRQRAFGVFRQVFQLRYATHYANVPIAGAWTWKEFLSLSERLEPWVSPQPPAPATVAPVPPPIRSDDRPWAALIAEGRRAVAAGDRDGARRALDELIRTGGTPTEVQLLRGVVARIGLRS
jgi:hypothetical protein